MATVVGCPSLPQLIDQLITVTRAMPAYKTSMALDFEAQRPMEIEAIIGNVVRTGRTHGVAMPSAGGDLRAGENGRGQSAE